MQLGLERVLFVPAQDQWRKQRRALSAPADRVAMVEAAIAGNPHFEVSVVDIERQASTYTADTLSELSGDHDLYFILGMDALLDLPNWKQPQRIVDLAWIIAALRPGYAADWRGLERTVPEARERVLLLTIPEIGISSTAIRQRVFQGQSIRYWVTEPVAEYIAKRGLYREPG